ncbi:hypothetical protein [Ilumatobacter fluminis]|uniref:hypothetical protein n=1 Tax=Ilumatobacter fluminis TaxID=467091 RepID=UPI0010620002|nr:hypothetical protein [Ilumatobacter fluminis]
MHPTETEGPKTGRKWRKALVGIIALLVVAGAAIAAVLIVGGGSDEYVGPNDDTVYLLERDGGGEVVEFSFVPFDSDDRPVEITDDAFAFLPALVAGGGLSSAETGGPVIGSAYGDDAEVRHFASGDDDFETLLSGGDRYDVMYRPDGDLVLIVETRSSGDRCYVGSTGEQPRRIARGDVCRFDGDGNHVMTLVDDGDETTYEVYDLDGERLLVGDSPSWPRFAAFDGTLIVDDGARDRYSVTLIDIETGRILAESRRGDEARVLDESDNGYVLVATRTDDDVVLERLGIDGSVVRLDETDEAVGGGFLTEDGNSIASLSSSDGRTELRIVSVDDDVVSSSDTLIAEEWVTAYVPEFGHRDGKYLAVSGLDDELDAVMSIETDEGPVAIDVDDLLSVTTVSISQNGQILFASVLTEDDGRAEASVLAVDLETAEYRWLIEDWTELSIDAVHPNGSGVLIVGVENDEQTDELIAHVDLAGTVELIDEGPEFYDVRFTADGDTVSFTVDDSDVDSLAYEIGSRTQPQIVYRDASIAWAGWDIVNAPRSVDELSTLSSSDDEAAERTPQDAVADMMMSALEESMADGELDGVAIDEACVRRVLGGLSDEDAQLILAAGPDDDPEGLSTDAEEIATSMLDCVDIDPGAIDGDS